ncbi:MAG TPA: adenylate/guanylate cyclase domain-containing protein, partial [Burkholderiaceae bacterium]|nr:adenylate/guanylate cyclase domain-containing protein [Burkholderiaceae bacterium]
MPQLPSAASRRRRLGLGVSPYRWRMTTLGLVLVALIVGAQIFSAGDPSRNTALTRVEAVWYDLRFQMLPPQRDSLIPIVIVDLDEATQQREGRWPWDRRKVGQLVQAIQHHGAVLIGFDVVFSEPGDNPVRQVLDAADLPAPVDRALNFLIDEFDGDAALGRALGDNTVLGYFFHADGGKAGRLPAPFLEFPDDIAASSTLIAMPDYTANLAVLTDHAWASGFVVAVPDADGIVRRMPLVMRHENGVYTSLGLEMSRLALAAPWVRLAQEQRGSQTVVTGVQLGRQLHIPLDERGNMLVPYRGTAGSFTTVSATGVLRGDAPPAQLAALDGAIVLVGTSALGLSDLRTIPLQTGFPGVEVHANVIDTILHAAMAASDPGQRSPFYLRPDWEPGATLALLLLSGLLMALILPGRTPSTMLVLTLGWLAVVVGANLLMWHVWHLALPIGLQLLMVLSTGAVNIAGGYLATNRQKRAIQSLFGEYVPPEHVERMLDQPGDISLEGEQRTMTVLFADVRSFTALSESLSPTELKAVLNRYLSAITAVIFEHHGTIDKYVGDLVMAFWNAPLDDPHHARNAVQAALAMQRRMV